MANEKRLIYLEDAVEKIVNFPSKVAHDAFYGRKQFTPMQMLTVVADRQHEIIDLLEMVKEVNAVELPCKIGDYAYAIRNYKGHIHPKRGIVSDMYFIKGMKLCVVVHGIGRGEWGKEIFGTEEEAYRAIEERKR